MQAIGLQVLGIFGCLIGLYWVCLILIGVCTVLFRIGEACWDWIKEAYWL